jgi:2-haloalkanoic acid dehalogenase type II
VTVRAIAFDLFDTLVDLHMDRLPIVEIGGRRVPSTLGALHEAMLEFREISLEDFAAQLRASDRELHGSHFAQGLELPTLHRFEVFCGRIGINSPELPQTLTETHMGKLREQVRILPHHRDVFAALRGRLPLAVISNFSHAPLAHRVLEEAGLIEDLDPLVISEQARYRKPRPEIFQAAADRLGLAAHEIAHVGDNLDADVRGAGELGMRTVWITRRVPDPEAALEAYEGPQPDVVIEDLAQLPAWLEGDRA